MGFKDELWDQFDEVARKTKSGGDFTTSVAEFIKKRAAIEKEYSKKMSALCKMTVSETGSACNGFNTIKDETEAIARLHNQLADELLAKSYEPVKTHLSDNAKRKQLIIDSGRKLVKDLTGAEKNMATARGAYEVMHKKKDDTKDEYEKAVLKNEGAAMQKLGKKVQSSSKKLAVADQRYKQSVDQLVHLQSRFYDEDMPQWLQEMETMETERVETVKSALVHYSNTEKSILPQVNDLCDRMRAAAAKVDADGDIRIFIDCKRTGASKPPKAQYVPYTSTVEQPAAASGVTTVAAGSVGKSKRERGGTTQRNAPTLTSQSSGTSIGLPAQRGMGKCRALYDYNADDPNELSFKKGDVIIILQKDPSGWWQGDLNGTVGVFPSVDWVEEIQDNAPAPSVAPTAVAAPVEPAPRTALPPEPEPEEMPTLIIPPEAVAVKRNCKVLYDYAAENEFELSIHAGETLHVEADDEGWFIGTNSSGKGGRFPSNYVELA